MRARNFWVIVAGSLWLCVLGVVGGVAIDRYRFEPQRAEVIALLGAATDSVNAQIAAPREARWEAALRESREAFARNDRIAADREWREAWRDATRARTWESMTAVGDAAMLMGEPERAREAYLLVLFRARGQHSLAGVLRASEAFEALGDRAVARECLRVAEALPGLGAHERELVRERSQRLAARGHASWSEQ